MKLRNVPGRIAAGGFILHSGLEKFSGGEEQAQGVHGMAAAAYPILGAVKPTDFLRALSLGEVAVGAALLTPFVSPAIAGAALTGFSGGLIGLYARTPALRKPNSIWPSRQGIGVSKDVWMLGIGLGLLIDAATSRDS